jgi:AAA family ATP:ADP antiporter
MKKFTGTERVFSLFTALRPGEGSGALRLGIQSFFIMLAYYLLKVIREPMILADGSAELKAYSTALQAVLLMVIVPLFARLYQQLDGRPRKYHLFRNTLLFFISNLLLLSLAVSIGLPVAIVFYVWLGIFSVMTLSLFWAFAADLYNLKSGQRLFPLIAAAAALGALAGALFAEPMSLWLGIEGVMLAAAAMLLVPWWLSRHTEHTIPGGSAAAESPREADEAYPLLEGFQIIFRSPYLSLIAAYVIVLNLINTNGEYILASLVTEYAQALPDNGSSMTADLAITAFYGQYFFITTLLSFLIQLFLVARIYDHLGIAGALRILPLLMIASYSLLAIVPVLAVARAALIAENSVNYSLQFTTRNALFLPVARRQKYIGKHTIETFFFRLGDVVSGGFVFVASAIIGLGLSGFIFINALLACVLLVLARAIGVRHDSKAVEAMVNLPPMATTQLTDLFVPAGRDTRLQLAADTFVDPDVGDALRYQAYTSPSGSLPYWVSFDSLDRSFVFSPPNGEVGDIELRVVARDYEGLEAEVSFAVHFGG